MDTSNISPNFHHPTSFLRRTYDTLSTFTDIELHYDFDSRYSVMHVLESIVHDLLSHSSIHNWDEKFIDNPVKDMAKSVNQELIRFEFYNASYVLTYSSVNEVATINGKNRKHHVPERYFPDAHVNSLQARGYIGLTLVVTGDQYCSCKLPTSWLSRGSYICLRPHSVSSLLGLL